MKPKRLLVYLFLIALLIPIANSTHTAKAVTLTPLTFELAANPGETISNIIRVSNEDSNPVNVVIEFQDFAPVGEEGQVTLQTGEVDSYTYSLASWVNASPNVLTIPGQDSSPVEFTITVPPDAEPGGHYASILASISGGGGEGAVSISQKVGSLLLMNVAGDVREQLHVEEFSAPSLSEYGPVNIVSRFENDGTVHLKPRGFILIKNIFGQEVDKLELPQKNVLPRSIRRIETEWGDKLMFGRYEATLTAIYGSTNQPLSSVTSFWIIPWKIATAVGIGIIILLAFFIKGRKRIRLALRVLFKGHKDQNFSA